MYSNFLGILLKEEISAFNHAYFPRKGTTTCVTALLTKVIKAPWVYEFDIKGFFDNVSIEDTLAKLEERGLPLMYADDGILYSDHPSKIFPRGFHPSHRKIKLSKTSWRLEDRISKKTNS
jgi:retron-type reverse transcriptase